MTGERADEAREWLLSAIARGGCWRDHVDRSPHPPVDVDVMTISLAAVPESVKQARSFARATLTTWGLADMSDDVGLVASELVTNALRHGVPCERASDPPIRFSLLRADNELICAVTDPSDRIPLTKEPDFAAQNGRGLHLVEAFSKSWSWARLYDHGKIVWATFST